LYIDIDVGPVGGRVDLQVGTNVSEEYTASIFRPEDGYTVSVSFSLGII
jgi:hypothetical protein